MLERQITIINKLGLHARASAKLVSAASAYAAEITIEKDGQAVNAKSIMGVMMLAAACGSEVILRTDGTDAEAAMEGVVALINSKFGEDE